MLVGVLAFSQSRVVTGKVIDEKGNPVEAASVTSGNKGQRTDANGMFRLENVAPNAIIKVTGKALGIVETSINSGTNSTVNFSVRRNANTDLEAVTVATVATGLGIKKQPRSLGFAQTTISSKSIVAGKSSDVAQALTGKISGVNITSINSGVFSDTKILLRGVRSLTGSNDPLLVVDGATTPLGYLTSFAPEDIANLTVIKSAAGAAIYGPLAINGVILITTKKGGSNDKLTVSFTSSAQFTKVAFYPKLQHRFGQGAGEIINPDGSYAHIPYENQLYGPAYDGTTKDIGVKLEDGSIQSGPYSSLYGNDKKDFYNTGLTLQNTVSLTGKDFFVSVDDAVIHGVVPDDKNRRTSFRFNGGKEYGKLNINYGLNYVLSNFNVFDESGQQTYTGGTSYNGGLFFQILQTADNIPLLRYKDWQNDKVSQYSNYYNEFSLNPYWLIGNHRSIGRTDDIFGNFDLSYKFSPLFKSTTRISTRVLNTSQQDQIAPIVVTDWAARNRAATNYSNKNGTTFNDAFNANTINFDQFFDGEKSVSKNFNVKYIVGGNIFQSRQKDVAVGGNDLSVPYLYNIGVRSGDANTGSAVQTTQYNKNFNRITQRSSYSLYGTLGFSFKNLAFIDFTGRNDWDSRLTKQNRSFFYPAVNASLILVDKESSLFNVSDNSFLSFLKLRGSYSKSANVNLGAYALQPTYSQPGGFPFGNTVGFTTGNQLPSANITPEFVYSTEAGFDVRLLKDRISLGASYFKQDCKQQILSISQPSSTGYPSALANAAHFVNYGVELDLGLSPLINLGKAKLNLLVNATYNNSDVKETFQNLPVTIGGSSQFVQNSVSAPTANNQAVVGMPAFVFQLTDYARDPASGKVIVDAVTGLPSQADNLVVKGRTLPKWIIGATPSISWGAINLSMTWDFKFGHNFYSGLGSDMDFSGISERSASFNRQNFIFPNSVYKNSVGKYVDNTDVLTQDGNYAFWTGANTNAGIATNYFASANALRLREVNLSYTIPASIFADSKFIKRVTFAVVGKNLLLFTSKSNQWGDPEFNSGRGNTYGVGSSFQAPSTRLLGLSLNVQF
jgi:TonB-linked SusC/RagA family outer membrane protein